MGEYIIKQIKIESSLGEGWSKDLGQEQQVTFLTARVVACDVQFQRCDLLEVDA